MNRNKRILIISINILILVPLLLNRPYPGRDFSSQTLSLAFLLLVCLMHFLSPFRTVDFMLFLLITVPAVFFTLHFLSGLLPWAAYKIIIKCLLILSLYHILYSLAGSVFRRTLQTILQLSLSLAVPAVSALFLLEQNIPFLLSPPIIAALLLYYIRSLKKNV